MAELHKRPYTLAPGQWREAAQLFIDAQKRISEIETAMCSNPHIEFCTCPTCFELYKLREDQQDVCEMFAPAWAKALSVMHQGGSHDSNVKASSPNVSR